MFFYILNTRGNLFLVVVGESCKTEMSTKVKEEANREDAHESCDEEIIDVKYHAVGEIIIKQENNYGN